MTIALAEEILLDKFKGEPFHNLYLLNNIQPDTVEFGGTCSEKALSYLVAARSVGLCANLHTARIGGKEIHRLVRLTISGCDYFADVGNGWPSIRLLPSDREIVYTCYGLRFRTTISNNVIKLYLNKRGVEKLQMEIGIEAKSEPDVYNSISNRFSSNIEYPFSKKLRFAMIVKNRFLFIRDTVLEIHSEGFYDRVTGVDANNLVGVVEQYFEYNIDCVK